MEDDDYKILTEAIIRLAERIESSASEGTTEEIYKILGMK